MQADADLARGRSCRLAHIDELEAIEPAGAANFTAFIPISLTSLTRSPHQQRTATLAPE